MLDYDIHRHRHNRGTSDIHHHLHQGHRTRDLSRKSQFPHHPPIHHHQYQRPRNQYRGCDIPANPIGHQSPCR